MILYAMDAGYIDQYLTKLENATSEDKRMALEQFGNKQSEGIMTRENGSDTASIRINGPLTISGPSPLARFFGFGGTGYNAIISAARELREDPTIENVDLLFNTPGGTVEGMDETKQALDLLASVKNVTAENHGMLASAGYYLAMATESIKAMSPLAVTGSIGAAVAGVDFTEAMARDGIREIKIVSEDAPDKVAGITTERGRSIVQEQVNAAGRVFTRVVAEGRNTTDADVISNFGKGGLLIAKDPGEGIPDALSVGMIDSVVIGGEVVVVGDAELIAKNEDLRYNPAEAEEDLPSQSEGDPVPQSDTAFGGNTQKEILMDLKTLKMEHPSVFAEAVQIGCAQERDRVEAHITMGEAAGDTAMAIENIKVGADLTPAINAKYMAAGMNASAVTARGDDNVDDIEVAAAADVDTVDDAVSAKLAEITGVTTDV